MQSYQQGGVKERKRSDGTTAFMLCWREGGIDRARTMPRKVVREGKFVPTDMKAARAALEIQMRDVNAANGGVVVKDTQGVTFNALMEQYWEEHVKTKKLRRTTVSGYSSMLKRWIEPHFGKLLMREITKKTVSEFFKKVKAAGNSPRYEKHMYCLLSSIFSIAVAHDEVAISPVNALLHLPNCKNTEKMVFPMELMGEFQTQLKPNGKCLVALLLTTSMRQCEILALRWKNVSFENHLIHKTHTIFKGELDLGLKTESKHTVGMSGEMEKMLQAHKATSSFTTADDFIFCQKDGRPMGGDHVRRYIITPALVAAGVPLQKHGSGLHMFRHTAASALNEETGDIKATSEQLGHSNISTTADTYTHVNAKQKIASANVLSKIFADILRTSDSDENVSN